MSQDQISFKAIADQYLLWSTGRHSQNRHKSMKASLEREILPLWADTPIADLRRADGRRLVTRIAARAPRQAAIANTVIRAIFELALDEGYIETNPMLGFSKIIPMPRPVPLRHILSPMEIMEVWTAISNGPGDDVCKRALKLMLVTGQRLSAIVGMHRREINGEWWSIPPERSRNPHRPHRIYLSPLALALIGYGKGYIFPSADPRRPIKGNAVYHLIRAICSTGAPHHGLPPWQANDLRRTVTHQMASLGIAPEALRAVLGLAQRDTLHKLYPVNYDVEIKEALKKWGDELRLIINNSPSPVLPPMPSRKLPIFGL